MKTYRMQTIESMDGFELCDEPVPMPGAGEVLVRIRANALNFRDLAVLQGCLPFGVQAGRVPLSDAAGVIEAIRMHVTRFAVGDRGVVSEQELVIMPSFLSFTEAATLPCAAVMAWSALAGVGPGEVVLTQGTGGVSLFAVRFAKAAGAKVVATTDEPMRETHNWPFATLPRLPTSDTYSSSPTGVGV
ncbi:MAG: hypothetical protein EOO77_22465 [Oxalobacteraceae bacterium]|nr:MAG: hypothetical protein EOO77_22465 [Oxalobacteraceae bacterium]